MNPEDELAWEAFRFISGDMNEAERAAFEDRLAADQRAREAVAGAVELTDASRAALKAPAVTVKSVGYGSSRLWYGIAMGVAASLLVMLAIHQFNTSQPQLALPNSEKVESAASDLAVRWSQLRERQHELNSGNDGAGELEADDLQHGEEQFSSTNAPAWMLAAVEQLQISEDAMEDGPLEQ